MCLVPESAHAQTHAPHALKYARAQGDTRQGYLGSTSQGTPLWLRLGSLDRTPNTMLTRHTHKHAPACSRAQKRTTTQTTTKAFAHAEASIHTERQ